MEVDEARHSALVTRESVTARPAVVEKADWAIALIGEDPQRAAVFVDAELGPIEAAGDRSERLLETLEVYLRHGQRVANASAISGRHRDTVHRHLREIEALLGCRIEERSADLLLALRLRHAFAGSAHRQRSAR